MHKKPTTMSSNMNYFIGVDVGTGSVRAAIVNDCGNMVSTSVVDIKIWNTKPDFYEQSSENIWDAVVKAIKQVIADSGVKPSCVKGLGFDATCSLVVLDHDMKPLTVSTEGQNERNIVLWMDHRAYKEAETINATGHKVLDTVGGSMSLEMQPPKLMWMKKNVPYTWKNAAHFFDLPDFLTWRATGSLSRSSCSLGCKWSFKAKEDCWDDEFLSLIGLEDLASNHHKIGKEVKNVGLSCGEGLSASAAKELGLIPGTAVGTSIIDAHAGALGCLSCQASVKGDHPDMDQCLVLIAGTSNCHIVCSQKRIPVPGVWGPYYNAMVPGMWVNEGGQSAAGSLIDFVTSKHAAFPAVKKQAEERGVHTHDYINTLLDQLAMEKDCSNVAFLTQQLHMWPDFHGNRSPLADPMLRGMISGLDLSSDDKNLAVLYLATVQALAYGTKAIVRAMEDAGHSISTVFVCGGLCKNKLFVQTHGDVLGLPMIIPDTEESVLLGSAILGMFASGKVAHIQEAMTKLGGTGTVIEPNVDTASYHKKKFAVFEEMLKDQRKYQNLMNSKQ